MKPISVIIHSLLILFVFKNSYALALSEQGAMPAKQTIPAIESKNLIVNLPNPNKYTQPQLAYFTSLIELSLQKTLATDGAFTITHVNLTEFTSNRLVAELIAGNPNVTIIWTANSEIREAQILPIKISILRGLNSYRVFLIRKEDQQKFHKVNNLQELRQLRAGQGSQWPDTYIMQSNGLPVVSAAKSNLLIDMLVGKRFDYFPRGLAEAFSEQKVVAEKNIVVEDSIMLHYPASIYFFVNKNNRQLADRVERGLRIAMQDGSFDELFFSVPGFKQALDEMKNPSRKIFSLAADFYDQD